VIAVVTKSLNLGMKLNGFNEAADFLRNKMTPWSSKGYLIGTNVEYSIYVEFGTSSSPAQPYLFRAAREVFSNVESIWEKVDDISQLLQIMAMRILRKAKIYCPVDTGNLRASIRVEQL